MAGAGGGAWKVAYADFVTAMMAFFLVMWIVAQNKDAKEAVSAYFRDPFGDSSRPSGTGNIEGSELKLKPPPETKLKGGAKVPILKMMHDRNGTPIGSYVQFNEESAAIDAAAERKLKDLIPLLLGKQNKIELRGHTARRSRTAAEPVDAWQLSYQRCAATKKFLIDHGIEPARLRLSQAGPYEPAVGSETATWRERNSRVEVIMLNEYVDDFAITKRRTDEEDEDGTDAKDDDHAAHLEPAKSGKPAGH
jgi:chemotaxis protein MotB